jgi:hypothetical protein
MDLMTAAALAFSVQNGFTSLFSVASWPLVNLHHSPTHWVHLNCWIMVVDLMGSLCTNLCWFSCCICLRSKEKYCCIDFRKPQVQTWLGAWYKSSWEWILLQQKIFIGAMKDDNKTSLSNHLMNLNLWVMYMWISSNRVHWMDLPRC